MKILPPDPITESNLTSNVAITETVWSAGTYATGTQRYVGIDLYEVVADPNTTDEPTAGAAKDIPTWIRIGVIERFRMFDMVIGDVSTRPVDDDLTVTIDASGTVNGVAVFNAIAASVQVQVTDPVEGVVYDETKQLSSTVGLGDFYSYFFGTASRDDTALFLNLPSYPVATITVIFLPEVGGSVSVGELVIGKQRTIGTTLMNFSFGIEDFSRKERDDFGRFIITERRFAKIAGFDVFLTNVEVQNAFRLLSEVRSTPVVYVGDSNRSETVILGFYRSFSTLRTGPISSEMTLEIEGIV